MGLEKEGGERFRHHIIMKILVTGAAGFMGSHLAEFLAKEGHDVVGIDNLSIGRIENVPDNIAFYKLDLTNKIDTKLLCEREKPELVYHLAAWAHEGLSQFMPILITENNFNAFMNLLVPALNNGMKRIVVTSSMSVYGNQEAPFNEDMPRKPFDIYAISKTAMEESLEILSGVHNFDYTILRPHNVYGPKQSLRDPYRNVVGIFMNRVMKGVPPIVYGDGQQTRAFSYIDDVTPYVAKAGFLDETKGEIINIGPREEYTVNELAVAVLEAFGSNLKPEHVADRPQEVKHAFCTNDKAERLLGYKTTVDLKTGVKKMADWANRIGPQEFVYLDEIELAGDKIPETWQKKIM